MRNQIEKIKIADDTTREKAWTSLNPTYDDYKQAADENKADAKLLRLKKPVPSLQGLEPIQLENTRNQLEGIYLNERPLQATDETKIRGKRLKAI